MLPKSLRTGKSRPRLLIDGRKVAGGKVRRALNPKLGSGVRRIKVVWKGLRRSRGKRIGKKLTIPVRLKDTRGKTTTLKLHVRVSAPDLQRAQRRGGRMTDRWPPASVA